MAYRLCCRADEIISAMNKVQSQSTSNPASISQKAAVEALKGPQDFIAKMLNEFDKRRRYIVERLNKIKGVTCAMPKGAFMPFQMCPSYMEKVIMEKI